MMMVEIKVNFRFHLIKKKRKRRKVNEKNRTNEQSSLFYIHFSNKFKI
jgi:hypothetical protein